MKPGKAALVRKKPPPASEVLEAESKRMEERLAELREHMKLESERRKSEVRFKDGSRWRGGLTTKPMHGYAETVLKIKPKPRPASKGFVPSSELLNFDSKETAEPLKRASTIPKRMSSGAEVRAFLESCGMEKYLEVLLQNGFDEMEVVMELKEEHLADLGLPLGHRIKLLKRIREAKINPVREAALAHKNDTSTDTAGDVGTQAEYSESDSHAMFKEALNEFRKGGTTTHHLTAPKETSVRLKEPRSFQVRTKPVEPLAPRSGTDESLASMTVSEGLMKDGFRDSCWECYSIFTEGVAFGNKNFCSIECAEKFKASLFLTCACGKEFTKQEGELFRQQWYCSETCPKLPVPEPESDEDNFIFIDPLTGDPIEH